MKSARRISGMRTGQISTFVLLFIASIVVVGVLGYLMLLLRPNAHRATSADATVRVYCASGIAKPVEQIIAAYNKQLKGNVEIVRTGGSGELAGQIATEFESGMSIGADLFVSADDLLLNQSHENGSIAEQFRVARQIPVIAVAANSELDIADLEQLVNQRGLRFGIASEQAAVGKLVRQIARRDGLLEALESNKATDTENVMTLAQALVTGSLDAAIIWDTVVNQLNQANGSPVLKCSAPADSSNQIGSNISIGVTSTTQVAPDALKFARYLTAPQTGQASFEQFGFSFVPGDAWEEFPEIHLYCGSMFTPVLEQSVREFAKREAINIYPRWEGCGKLVASMESIQDPSLFPDAYLACDEQFLHQVQQFFHSPTTISTNQIVMVVGTSVSAEIDDPNDLPDSGLRIGICDSEQSALGLLTKQMLSAQPFDGLYQKINRQASVTVDVGPTLISQLLAGGLDVAFVYRSNIMADNFQDTIRIIEIDSRAQNRTAIQPWAISKSTQNPALMQRFYEWINRPIIHERFEKFGFKRE